MPSSKTEITEVVTGLALFGSRDLDTALASRPSGLENVSDDVWNGLIGLRRSDDYRREFTAAWNNGQAFLDAREGLRGRPPLRVEWRGAARPPGDDPVPADLRVDHVYLISCKYLSKVLSNAAPSRLFDHALAERLAPAGDWYAEVAGSAYQALYDEARRDAGVEGDRLPPLVNDLTPDHRRVLRDRLRSGWSTESAAAYRAMGLFVGEASAERWRRVLKGRRAQERMLWRLLRIGSVPYFVLGSSRSRSLRLRVMTPWDWRQVFELKRFDVWGDDVGQPVVRWRAEVRDRQQSLDVAVEGHVEVRWSHGRFGGPPEAKAYLDTEHHRVPGYVALQ